MLRKNNKSIPKRKELNDISIKNKEQIKVFTLEKVNNKKINGDFNININGKQLKNKIYDIEIASQPKSLLKVEANKKNSKLTSKNISPIPNFNKVLKNEKSTNIPLTAEENRSRYKIENIKKSSELTNPALSTERVSCNRWRNREFCHMNEEILTERRENQLNSKFKERVSRLNNITKENRKIYCRINSQKSHYLKEDMNKSYESNMEISRRLSMSKVSQRSERSERSSVSNNSRCSIGSNYSIKSLKSKNNSKNILCKGIINKNTEQKEMVKIESNNINQLKNHQLEHFATLFDNNKTKNGRIKSRMSARNIKSINYKENHYPIEEISKTVELKKTLTLRENQKLPKISKLCHINENTEQFKQNQFRKSSSKKKILSTIDENIPLPKNEPKNLISLHKITEEPFKPSRLTFTFGSVAK